MKNSLKLVLAVLGAPGFLFNANALAAPPPASAFGRLPGISKASISPDGQHIALVAGPPAQRTLTLAVVDSPRSLTEALGKTDIDNIYWAGDKYAILAAKVFQSGHNYGNGVDYNYHVERDIVIDTDGKAVGRLLSNSDASALMTALPVLAVSQGSSPSAIVLGLDWNGDRSLMSDANTHFRHDGNDFVPALWKVDVASGRGVLAERGEPNTSYWLVDCEGGARVRVDYNPVTHVHTLVGRPKSAAGWTIINQTEDPRAFPTVLGYSDAEDAVYLRVFVGAEQEIVRHSLATGAETVIEKTAGSEGLSMRWDELKKEPVAVGTQRDVLTYRWLNPTLGAIDAKLSRVLKDKIIGFHDWSADDNRVIVTGEAADSPTVWYLFDNIKNSLSPIGAAYPELDGVALGKVSFFTYKARDGLAIPAYLTLPPGVADMAAAHKLPLIVMPHGGPAARDNDDFDWWSQYLATRGYVVLRPEFRGSAGFGKAFEVAGDKEWGGKMQTDLLDGVSYLAAKGAIDPRRVCIVGASFGGYGAMAGATLHPEAYKCAVAVNGISDLGLLLGETAIESDSDSAGVRGLRKLVGDAREEPALIAATSPAKHIESEKAPILLVYSQQDTTVHPEQTLFFDEALKRAGKPVEMVELKNDDHYMSKSGTRTEMLEATGKFLQANLPVGQ